MIEEIVKILDTDNSNLDKARLINKLYLNHGRCSNVHIVVGLNGKIVKCFKKPKNAENYIGNSSRYVIEKLKVE